MQKTLRERAPDHILVRKVHSKRLLDQVVEHLEIACAKAVEIARRDYDKDNEVDQLPLDLGYCARQYVRAVISLYFQFLDNQGMETIREETPDNVRPSLRYKHRPHLDPQVPSKISDDSYLSTNVIHEKNEEQIPTSSLSYKDDRNRAHARIRELHASNIPKNRMVSILESEGIHGPHGGKWHVTSIGRVLAKP